MASPAIAFAKQNQQRFLEELKDLLRIPSVSTLPEHRPDVERAAAFVASELRRIGLEHVEIIPTAGHPLVYADWLHADADKPTVLIYAHYDVQPAEPLDDWTTPPFEPAERNQNLYARGAVDDKGQLWMQVKALESLMKGAGKLPVNVRVLYEGEEEVGGAQIEKFVHENGVRLKSDFALVCDTELFAPDLPTLCVGLRGIVYTEIEARGPSVDLHSGMYGGAVPNPLFALCGIISKLKDADGRVLIPGFYDRVTAPSHAELQAWRQLPFHEEYYRQTEVGSTVLTGEPEYPVLYRTWARPTLEVHGIPGGFTGAGAKTVIPAKASAKVSLRLVPDQDPGDILKKFSSYVMSLVPRGIQLKVSVHSSGKPVLVSTDNDYIRAATQALREVFGKETVFIRSGGSIPIVGQFQEDLKIPTVMMGLGLPDDNIHAPNEKFHIPNFYRGIESIVRFLSILGGK